MTVILLQFPWHTHTYTTEHTLCKKELLYTCNERHCWVVHTLQRQKKKKQHCYLFIYIVQPKPLLGFSLLIFVVAGFLRFEIFNGT